MSVVVSLIILLTVQEWTEGDAGVTAKFGDGTVGLLSRSSPDYAYSVDALTTSGKAPIVVQWGGKGVVVEASRPRRDAVREIHDLPDGSWRLKMTRMNGMPRLLPGNPDVARIRSVISASIAEKRDVWLAIKLPDFTVADALLVDK